MITTRRATLQDAAPIADLSTQLGYPSNEPDVRRRLVPVLTSDDDEVIVACNADDTVVGWIHVFIAHRVETDAFAEIGGLVVSSESRGEGVGRTLMAAAEEWSRRRGVASVRVRSRTEREEAHMFYERIGYRVTKQQRIFDKTLPEE